MRDIPYTRYDKFLGHKLSQDEVDELTALYDECHQNIYKAAGACCLATTGTFIREARYIKNILDRK